MTPTRRVALAMAAVSAVGIVVYFVLGWAKAWMPNVVVGAITVALTITVIEGAVRQELKQRYAGRRLPARFRIAIAVKEFARFVRSDYLATHTEMTRSQPEFEVVALLDQWLSAHESEDVRRGPSQRLGVAEAGVETLKAIQEIREPDGDLLPPDVVSAIDRLEAALAIVMGILAHRNRAIHNREGEVVAGPEHLENQAQVETVEAFRSFVADSVAYIPEIKLAPRSVNS